MDALRISHESSRIQIDNDYISGTFALSHQKTTKRSLNNDYTIENKTRHSSFAKCLLPARLKGNDRFSSNGFHSATISTRYRHCVCCQLHLFTYILDVKHDMPIAHLTGRAFYLVTANSWLWNVVYYERLFVTESSDVIQSKWFWLRSCNLAPKNNSETICK